MNYYNVHRDQAKQLFIIILYDGQFSLWRHEHNIRRQELPFISQMKKNLILLLTIVILK